MLTSINFSKVNMFMVIFTILVILALTLVQIN